MAGSFSMHAATKSLSAVGTDVLMCARGRGVEDKIWLHTADNESPANGDFPVIISYSTTPSEKISERTSCARP